MAQEAQIDEKVIRKLLPEVDIDIFQVKADRLLILPDDEKTGDLKTPGGVIIGEVSTDKIRKTMLTQGTIVKVGKDVGAASTTGPELQVGMTVFFYRANSIGAIRQGEQVYILFNEYHIEGFLTPETNEQKAIRMAQKTEPVLA